MTASAIAEAIKGAEEVIEHFYDPECPCDRNTGCFQFAVNVLKSLLAALREQGQESGGATLPGQEDDPSRSWKNRALYAERCRVVDLEKRLAAAEKDRDEARAYGEKWRRIRVPKHGTCCHCQGCGLHYDECRCSLDGVVDERDALAAKVIAAELVRNSALRRAEAAEARLAESRKTIYFTWTDVENWRQALSIDAGINGNTLDEAFRSLLEDHSRLAEAEKERNEALCRAEDSDTLRAMVRAAEARLARAEEALEKIAWHELPIGTAMDAIFQSIARAALAPGEKEEGKGVRERLGRDKTVPGHPGDPELLR